MFTEVYIFFSFIPNTLSSPGRWLLPRRFEYLLYHPLRYWLYRISFCLYVRALSLIKFTAYIRIFSFSFISPIGLADRRNQTDLSFSCRFFRSTYTAEMDFSHLPAALARGIPVEAKNERRVG